MPFDVARLRFPSLRGTLALDAAFEFAVATSLLVFASKLGHWLAFGTAISVACGVIFAVAGFAITWLARQQDLEVARGLAFANVAGGAAGWAACLAAWSVLEPEGRWLLGAASDAVMIIGLLELGALRRAH